MSENENPESPVENSENNENLKSENEDFAEKTTEIPEEPTPTEYESFEAPETEEEIKVESVPSSHSQIQSVESSENFSEISLNDSESRTSEEIESKEIVVVTENDERECLTPTEQTIENSENEMNDLSPRDEITEKTGPPIKKREEKRKESESVKRLDTVVLHSSDETEEQTFDRLAEGIESGSISHKDVVNSVFQALVGGPFDMESKFIIQNASSIEMLVKLLDICSPELQAELWCVFIAIVRKSNRNLEACVRVGLIIIVLDRLEIADNIIADLMVELLGVLSQYSINVKEMKHFLKTLESTDQHWKCHSSKLLYVMKHMPKRDGPDVFFSFSGNPAAGIALPPIAKWPYQYGWTFSTWLRMDPMNGVNFEKERPYVYCFRTSKGLGYSCHLLGNCLVITSMKVRPGRGYTRCVKHELTPRKWHHVVISHHYSRWGRSEVHCYVDGQLVENMEMSWFVSTSDHFDKCFIGCSPEGDIESSFCGQMGAVYVFAEAMNFQQVNSLYCLGPAYQSHFKYESETDLPEGYKKYLFDNKLCNCLMMAYCPRNCDRQLCLSSTPKHNPSYFVHMPHAAMKQGVSVVITQSVHSSLHSVGGMQMLLPLFRQLDVPQLKPDGSEVVDYTICSTLLSVIEILLETSPLSQQQLFQNKGFLLISDALIKSSKEHLSWTVLETFISMAKFLLSCASGIPLLKQLFDYVLFNPGLWIHTPAQIQIRLYNYLSTEFLSNAHFQGSIRRTSTILQILHAIKYYYWLVDPRNRSGFTPKGLDGPRPSNHDIVKIRASLLSFVRKLMLKEEQPAPPKEDEIQGLFNYIMTVHEDDNLYDLLQMTVNLVGEDPSSMVPGFDHKKGICIVFKLLASQNELIRLPGLKMVGFFLCRATLKRKNDVMSGQNLFTLLTDRLLLNASHLTMGTYNALFEILTEQVTAQVSYTKHNLPTEGVRFENPLILKVIANLLSQSESCAELIEVKQCFLIDLIAMCENSRENRRTILQMSVWQEWLISLAYIFPQSEIENQILHLVYRIFGMLLHHAVKLEYGGWRVWVDTLAIVHSKVSWEQFRRQMAQQNKTYSGFTRSKSGQFNKQSIEKDVRDTINDMMNKVCNDQNETVSPRSPEISGDDRPSSIYRTPEFRWSKVHIKLLSDLLVAVEADVDLWKSEAPTKPMVDTVNSSENSVFVANTVHILSQLVDSLIMACGGLLPLLAAATSPNSELEIADSTNQGLSIEVATGFLIRFMNLADAFIFTSALNFSDLEQEKNMPAGGILRQTLRIVATVSVRNILACRLDPDNKMHINEQSSKKQATRKEAIRRFVEAVRADQNLSEILNAASPINDMEHLLQDSDLGRLKAVVYRDMEEQRQAQFLALAVTYFLSVLMVSRYRDILEPPSSPSPFFDTGTPRANDDGASTRSVSSATLVNGDASAAEKAAYDNQESASAKSLDSGNPPDDSEVPVDPESSTMTEEDDLEMSEDQKPSISAIQVDHSTTATTSGEEYKPEQLGRLQAPSSLNITIPGERQAWLSTKLQRALESSGPLLREIMADFRSFLQRTLLGTHGQEIMNDNKVLFTLRNQQGSVIELVMLLCSQEWQTSLQKHAGLAFIELVNEGRLMAHATRDHILRVANEADFILNRLRAEDVSKHAEFEGVCAEVFYQRKEEEKTCDHLISAARRRDHAVAARIYDKILNILQSAHGAWGPSHMPRPFWRLDVWEDDSRRRKRFVPNSFGSTHPEATLKAAMQHGESAEDVERAREELLSHLVSKKLISPRQLATGNALADLVDEADIANWSDEQSETELTQIEPANFTARAKLIWPGLVVPGTVSVTATDLFFDCNEDDPEFQRQDSKVLRYCDNLHGRWHFTEIRAIFLRRYLLQNTALELFLASRTAIMFAFPDHDTVKKVVQHLPRVGVGVKYGLPQSRKASLMSPRQLYKHSDMPQKWQRREISNFDYLMFLNTIAGRTYNDLNQYPVFPWIISNYETEELDLHSPGNFRDLSKPIGALTPSRQAYFEDRYNNWEHDTIPAFHYGTHYSTAAFTLNWMIRMEPFTTMFLHLQEGKFDQGDRLFHSLADSWASCQRDSHDVKELIPELYFLPEIFRNNNKYKLGKRDDGATVGDVLLPPWAKTPEQFVMVHRQALESDLVSCQLHQWIDIIFGYKQRGPEAVRSTNVFYYLTYEGALSLDSIEDPSMRQSLENQMQHFGQTPAQLLTEPHPPRQSVMTISPMIFQPVADDLAMVMKFISNSPVVHLSANTYQQLANPTVVSITDKMGFSLNKWNNNFTGPGVAPAFPVPTGSTNTAPSPSAGQSDSQNFPNLPLTVDPLLAAGNPAIPVQRRHLGEAFDQRLKIRGSNFVTMVDSRCILAAGYPDHSFRVIDTNDAHVRQVVYGHRGVVTLLARSECNLMADCYIASGSQDCTVLLWHWNAKTQAIAGERNITGELPAPRAILTGHDNEITCIVVSAEHGLIISGSKDGAVLLHTTAGELLRCLERPQQAAKDWSPRVLLMSRECMVLCIYNDRHMCLYTTSGRVLNYSQTDHDIQCAAMTRDGEYVVTAGNTSVVSVYRLFGLQKLYSYQPCDSPVTSIALAQNHRFILAGLHSGAIVVFNIDFNKWHYEYKNRYPQR